MKLSEDCQCCGNVHQLFVCRVFSVFLFKTKRVLSRSPWKFLCIVHYHAKTKLFQVLGDFGDFGVIFVIIYDDGFWTLEAYYERRRVLRFTSNSERNHVMFVFHRAGEVPRIGIVIGCLHIYSSLI